MGVGPAQDPQYLAFLRASGFDDEQARAEIAARQAEIQAQKVLKRNAFAQQLMSARGQVQDEFQDRGMYGSGARLQADTRAIAETGQRQAEYEQGLGRESAGLDRDLVSTLARSARERAEEGLLARDRVAIGNARAEAGLY